MMGLTDPTCAPAGQVYFISDGTPIRNADFFAPLVEARDAKPPTAILPVSVALYFANVCENIYHISRKLGCPIEPFLTQAEVYKVGVTHYFSIAKARRDLGYSPTITSQEGAKRMARYYRDRPSNTNYFRIPGLIWWVAVLGGLANHAFFTFYVDERNSQPGTLVNFLDRGILTSFQSRTVLKHIWNWAIGAHVAEGIAATVIARRMGCSIGTTTLWAYRHVLWGTLHFDCCYGGGRFTRVPLLAIS
jgi:hypothetical protein